MYISLVLSFSSYSERSSEKEARLDTNFFFPHSPNDSSGQVAQGRLEEDLKLAWELEMLMLA